MNPLLSNALLDGETETPEELFLRIVTYMDMYFWDNDRHASVPHLVAEFETSAAFLLENEERFDTAFNARGLPPVGFSVASKPKPVRKSGERDFDPKFIAACNLVCDTLDKRATVKKLETIQVTSKQWHRFLADPEYLEYYKKRINKSLGITSANAKAALAKNVEAGDLQSIKYWMELTGEYRPDQQIRINIGQLLGQLMEILPRFLTPSQMVEVADEFERVLAIETTGREIGTSTS